MIPLKEILGGALKSVRLGPVGDIAVLTSDWPELVGPELAGITSPVKIDGSKLLINVFDPAFMEAMEYSQVVLLDRISAKLGKGVIRELRLVPTDRK
jgi:hypothetical protein